MAGRGRSQRVRRVDSQPIEAGDLPAVRASCATNPFVEGGVFVAVEDFNAWLDSQRLPSITTGST